MNPKQALGLPPGSVRALLAFLFSISTCWAALSDHPEAATALAGFTGTVLMGYFNKPKPEA